MIVHFPMDIVCFICSIQFYTTANAKNDLNKSRLRSPSLLVYHTCTKLATFYFSAYVNANDGRYANYAKCVTMQIVQVGNHTKYAK